ncbi:MAG: CHC2 zinc finger domain-containing protein [Pyrinomonadaceae bacterium]
MGDYVDFKAVKAGVSLEEVAARFGVSLSGVNGSHRRAKCPLPSHPAGDDAKSFSVNVTKQVWICHSTGCAEGRRGKKGGDVIELVSVMESCSLREAGLKLAAWYGIEMKSESSRDNLRRDTSASHQRPDEPRLETEISGAGDRDARYGVYDPLAEWIELRAASASMSPFERSAYIAVLGQIEELARADSGGRV